LAQTGINWLSKFPQVLGIGDRARTGDFNDTPLKGQPHMPTRTFLSIDEASDELGVSRRTLRRLISGGKLPAYKVSANLVRIKSEDLEKVLSPITPNHKMGY
jgi:excisionase family DNA binding protein